MKTINMKITFIIFLSFFSLSCTNQNEIQLNSLASETEIVDEIKPHHLPMAHWPQALFYMKSSLRTCYLNIGFNNWNSKESAWTRLSCGMGEKSYDMRIEYLGHQNRGDTYKYELRFREEILAKGDVAF